MLQHGTEIQGGVHRTCDRTEMENLLILISLKQGVEAFQPGVF